MCCRFNLLSVTVSLCPRFSVLICKVMLVMFLISVVHQHMKYIFVKF